MLTVRVWIKSALFHSYGRGRCFLGREQYMTRPSDSLNRLPDGVFCYINQRCSAGNQ
ncbi:hypothetical protein NEIELOOT_02922 [Neisseria elongata subsp. glycolytica ATCC 29315]|uniref:Uncharacterized protein n=1 Tax=Neisseria elongata subsp. glycolytica ATCC 29315 TaxID=546263 RepID=D4DV06_NEIEG|nr:hypothetical protein NEIELOOT_02922 [Neisseria elongata subsp. glycolytica ATCC 29315]